MINYTPYPKYLFFAAVIFFTLSAALPLSAGNKITQGDPMVKITTLRTTIDLTTTMAKISEDVSDATGLPETFVTYYWQFFENTYCPGCEKAGVKEVVFIDLYTPGFLTVDDRRIFMISLAQAIANNTPYSINDIYIHTHIADKHQLFIMGNIIRNWKQVGGPDDSM